MKYPSTWGKRLTAYRYVSTFAVLLCFNLFGCSASIDRPQAVTTTVAEAPPAAPQSPAPIQETTVMALNLQDLVLSEEQGQSTLFIKLSRPADEFRHFPLPQPARIVIDVFGKTNEQPEIFRLDTHWLSTLRVGSIAGALRLTLDVAAATVPAYTVSLEDGGIKIVIGSIQSNAAGRKQVTLVKNGKRANVIANVKSADSLAEMPPAQEKTYTGQKISLDFKDADIKNVFRLLAEVSGLNIVVTEDVSRKVTIRLVEIPWDQALDLLIATNGLAKDEIGNVIRISTPATLKTEADVLLAAEKAQEDREKPQTRYFNVNYANAKTLEERIKPLLGPRGTLVSDERSNIIMVRDLQKHIDDVQTLVSTLDTRTSQVLIESNLIETSPSFARALGLELNVSWRGLTLQTGFTADQPFQLGVPASRTVVNETTPLGVQQTITENPAVPPKGFQLTGSESPLGPFASLNAILSAAEQEGNIRTISRPSVVTLNNVGSTIKSTRVLRIALPASTNIASGTGAAAGTAVATERVEVGITLEVIPQVSNDGFVLLFIKVVSSTLGTQSPGSVIPDELRREASAKVLVRDGETIVIGGIMKDVSAVNETGVPWLRNIPVLGWLFKKTREQKDFEELMVFITPRILAAGSTNLPTAEQLWRDNMKKTEGDKSLVR